MVRMPSHPKSATAQAGHKTHHVTRRRPGHARQAAYKAPAPDRRGRHDRRLPEAPAHTGDMRRIIGTIVGAILAVSLAFTAVGRIVATLKMFLIIGLIAIAVVIIVWLVARRPRRD